MNNEKIEFQLTRIADILEKMYNDGLVVKR